MTNKTYFAYIRVSTTRQGILSTSLTEQRAAIHRYAEAHNLSITEEFEEQETAAKKGRRVFLEIIQKLKAGKASGLIMHKIDRGARNLKDWAELGDLIDAGIDIQFANESLDLFSRGGRLSADIQAVVAADYIRNLREEVRKGFYGRIKQGLYPMPAPLGYCDRGAGKVKAIDPAIAPLIRKMFQFYASGQYGLNALVIKMNFLGLRGRKGQKLTRNGISHILNNHFYTGVIRIKVSEQFYPGKHEAIISQRLFDRVQYILKRRLHRVGGKSALKEAFLFRGLVSCKCCSAMLIAEQQKGYIYYRCHTRRCPQKTVREEIIQHAVIMLLKSINRVVERLEDKAPQYLQTAYMTFQLTSYAGRRKVMSKIIEAILVEDKKVILTLRKPCETTLSAVNLDRSGLEQNMA